MRVFMIIPDVESFPRPPDPTSPHVGVAYVTAMLEKHGHEVEVFDQRLHYDMDSLQKRVKRFDPQVVGVTSYSIMYSRIYNIISELKKWGDYRVVIGGPHVSAFQRKVLEESEADIAVRGEGEFAMLEICQGADYPGIDGLIWRDGKSVVENRLREPIMDLDSLPFPAYHKYELDKYLDKKLLIVSSRGCTRKCLYCTIRLTMGAFFRGRSPANVVDEIEYWYNSPHKYRFFQFSDDCFSADIERAKRICDLIVERGLKIGWELRNGIMVHRLDQELLEKMKKSGCRLVAWGVESIDPGVMRSMKKGITANQVRQAIALSHQVSIQNSAFFMIGLPGDTMDKFKKNFAFAKTLPLDEVRFYNTTPYPGTELYDWVDKNARWLVNKETYLLELHGNAEEPMYETAEFPAAERRKAIRMGRRFVVRLFLLREFGPVLGRLFYYLPWDLPIVRNIAFKVGGQVFALWRRLGKRTGRDPI